MATEDRCTGHCCEMFTLPFGPDELTARCASEDRKLVDGEIIRDMVVYLGPTDKHPGDGTPLGRTVYLYTCRHFDRERHDCRIYETRPRMCREYPYGKRCLYPACTWAAAREGRVDGQGNELPAQLEVAHA